MQNTCINVCMDSTLLPAGIHSFAMPTYSIMAQTTILLLPLTIIAILESVVRIGFKFSTLISKSANVYRMKVELNECMRHDDEQRFISPSHIGHM